MNYALALSSAAATDPVTTTEAKAHCNITISTDDTYIAGLITAATQYAQNFCRRQFVTATWKMYLDSFYGDIRIPLPPCQMTNFAISYYDTGGTLISSLTSTDWQLDVNSEPARLCPAYATVWPVTRAIYNAVTITFQAGYGAAAAVPAAIKQAILIHVSHLYEHREPIIVGQTISNVPMSVDALLWPYRVWEAK